MTAKEYLEQYLALNDEIIQIEKELGELCSKPTHYATDSVMASPAHEPYQNRPIPVSGHVQENAVVTERKKLVGTYDRKLAELYKQRNSAECILSAIDDAKARTIIRYRYIEGMEWNDIAAKMGPNATVDSVKKYAYRYLQKNF